MIAVVENDTNIEAGSFVDDIANYLPDSEVFDIVRDGDVPSLLETDALVLAGSSAGVYDEDDHSWMAKERTLLNNAAQRGIPILGICFGHQFIHHAFGGTVEKGQKQNRLVSATLRDDPLFDGMEPVVPVLHSDYVVDPAAAFDIIAKAPYYEPFATRHESLPIWTVQFHPEYTPNLSHLVDDWTQTEFSFDDCNAPVLFENFHCITSALHRR